MSTHGHDMRTRERVRQKTGYVDYAIEVSTKVGTAHVVQIAVVMHSDVC